eukprot:g70623.t1
MSQATCDLETSAEVEMDKRLQTRQVRQPGVGDFFAIEQIQVTEGAWTKQLDYEPQDHSKEPTLNRNSRERRRKASQRVAKRRSAGPAKNKRTRRYQKSSDLLIRKLPFQLAVKEINIAQKISFTARWSPHPITLTLGNISLFSRQTWEKPASGPPFLKSRRSSVGRFFHMFGISQSLAGMYNLPQLNPSDAVTNYAPYIVRQCQKRARGESKAALLDNRFLMVDPLPTRRCKVCPEELEAFTDGDIRLQSVDILIHSPDAVLSSRDSVTVLNWSRNFQKNHATGVPLFIHADGDFFHKEETHGHLTVKVTSLVYSAKNIRQRPNVLTNSVLGPNVLTNSVLH